MKIKDVMKPHLQSVTPDESVKTVAALMAAENIGSVPVTENRHLVGMLTEHDLIVRVIAQQQDPSATLAGAVMNREPPYCYEDEECDAIAGRMVGQRDGRLPVLDREKQLVGVITVAELPAGIAIDVVRAGDSLDEALTETFPASDPISPA